MIPALSGIVEGMNPAEWSCRDRSDFRRKVRDVAVFSGLIHRHCGIVRMFCGASRLLARRASSSNGVPQS
jgi:hypothetical protein